MKKIINNRTGLTVDSIIEGAYICAAIDEQHVQDNCIISSLHIHHVARARGYVKKGQGYIEQYAGRFGNGYIYHRANVDDCTHYSNNYHTIVYYIY